MPQKEQARFTELSYKVLDGLREGVCLIDHDFQYLYLNQIAARQLQQSRDRLLGKALLEEHPGLEETELFAALQRCMTLRAPCSLESEQLVPGGAQGWLELRVEPVPEGVALFSTDIARRKRVETALQRAKRALAVVGECSHAIIQASQEVELLQRVCAIAVKTGGYGLAWAGLKRPGEPPWLQAVAVEGAARGDSSWFRVELDDSARGWGATGQALHKGSAVVQRLGSDPGHEVAWAPGCASLIALPFTVEGDTAGVLHIYAPEPDAFAENERLVLERLTQSISYGVSALRDRQARRELNASHRALFKHSFDALLMARPDGQILSANPAACQMFGRSEAEICRIGRAGLVDLDDPRMEALLRERGLRGRAAGRIRMVRGDGERFEAEISSALFEAPDGPRLSLIIRDISERAQAQARLRESEERYRLLFEHAPVGIAVHAKGKLVFTNPAGAALMGYRSPEELVGTPIMELVHPERRDAARDRIQRLLQGEAGLYPVEDRYLRKDGSTAEVSVMAVPTLYQGEAAIQLIVTDITERQKAERALVASERRYRALFENMNTGFVLFEVVQDQRGAPVDLIIRAANAGFTAASGLEVEAVLHQSLVRSLPGVERDPAGWIQIYGRVASSGQAEQFEMHSQLLDRWYSISAYCAGPGLCGVTFTDVTERRQAMQVLARQEERFRQVFEAANVGKSITTADGEILANRAMAEMLGYQPEELRRKTWQELTPREDVTSVNSIVTRLRSGEMSRARFDKRYLRKNGEIMWADVSTALVRDAQGAPSHFITTIIDITDKKRAEEARRESEERYRRLAENLPDIVWRAGVDGTLQYANRAISGLLGFLPEEVQGEPLAGLLTLNSHRRLEAWLRRLQAERADRFAFYADIEHLHKDGRVVPCELHAVPLLDAHGAVVGFEGVARDIQERRRMEEERGQLQAQLQSAQKMESIGRLAGGVAHDFNNLLAVIICYAEFALERLRPENPMRADIAEVLRAGERAASLTRQLLAFSRKQLLEPTVLDLNHLIEELQRMLQRLLGENVRIETWLEQDLRPILADPGQIDQVLMNLAVNARDAMPRGGTLTFSTSEVEIPPPGPDQRSAVAPGSYALLSITDTGIGMEQETLAQIFEPFFTTKEQGKGTGLGLATVYGIVKQSGGEILVSSQPGQGTTFEVYLPLLLEAAPTTRQAPPSLASGSETILIVEDDAAVRRLTERILLGAGYHVLVAATPDQALRLCQDRGEPIDLLLTDMIMPGMNGRELSERLQQQAPQLAVLYMSGYTDEEISSRGGVLFPDTHFIHKPFSGAALLRKVHQTLRQSL